MLDLVLDTIFNGLLIGTTGYAMYTLDPVAYPCAFSASAVGFCHGCSRIYVSLFEKTAGSEENCMRRAQKLTGSCMELMSLPLANIDLYRRSQQSNALSLGHGLFVVPLAFELAGNFLESDGVEDDESTAVLKDLTVLGNIVSLIFFAVNENNLYAGIMASSAFWAHYGSSMLESMLSGTGMNLSLAANSLFFGLLPLAIGAGGTVAN